MTLVEGVVVVVVVVVLLVDFVPPPHPTANTNRTAAPNTVMAVLA